MDFKSKQKSRKMEELKSRLLGKKKMSDNNDGCLQSRLLGKEKEEMWREFWKVNTEGLLGEFELRRKVNRCMSYTFYSKLNIIKTVKSVNK